MTWEKIFHKEGKVFYKIDPRLKKIERVFLKNNVKTILDLGCGSGRHTVFLAKKFKVTGMDLSRTGLNLTKKELTKKRLKAKLVCSSCYKKFPFKDNSFDALVSTQVIQHNTHDKVIGCIKEIHRILKKDGLLFITVPYRRNQKITRKKMISKHEYVPIEGREKGIVHFIYNKKFLKEDFHQFKILILEKDIEKGHYVFLGIKS